MNINQQIGAKIRDIRITKGLTQENVAYQLEMSNSGYAKIERGEVDLKISRLSQISDNFGVRLSDIMASSETNNFNNHGIYSAVGINATLNFHISKEEFDKMKNDIEFLKKYITEKT